MQSSGHLGCVRGVGVFEEGDVREGLRDVQSDESTVQHAYILSTVLKVQAVELSTAPLVCHWPLRDGSPVFQCRSSAHH